MGLKSPPDFFLFRRGLNLADKRPGYRLGEGDYLCWGYNVESELCSGRKVNQVPATIKGLL